MRAHTLPADSLDICKLLTFPLLFQICLASVFGVSVTPVQPSSNIKPILLFVAHASTIGLVQSHACLHPFKKIHLHLTPRRRRRRPPLPMPSNGLPPSRSRPGCLVPTPHCPHSPALRPVASPTSPPPPPRAPAITVVRVVLSRSTPTCRLLEPVAVVPAITRPQEPDLPTHLNCCLNNPIASLQRPSLLFV